MSGPASLTSNLTAVSSNHSTTTKTCHESSTSSDLEAPPRPVGNGRWEPGFGSGALGRVRHFAPAWFAANMGTGICAIILDRLPYQFRGLHEIAACFFVLNAVLFFIFLFMSVVRYIVYPSHFGKMLRHPASSLFLGTFAMGFATVGNGVTLFCVPAFSSPSWITLAWACWWIDSVISVLIAIGVPYYMFTRQTHTATTLSAVWLLPLVAPIVAAAMGGIVADVLEPNQALLTVVISYMMLGLGLAPALLVFSIYFQRLAVHKAPPAAIIISTFLPVGPCGQSAFAFLQLGGVLKRLSDAAVESGGTFGAPLYTPSQAATMVYAIYGLSMITSMFLLGLGIFWFVVAVSMVLESWRKDGMQFNLGWWGLVFPTGTMATACILLAAELDSDAIRALAMAFSMFVVGCWIYVGPKTAIEAWKGAVFIAPELMMPPPAAAPAAVVESKV